MALVSLRVILQFTAIEEHHFPVLTGILKYFLDFRARIRVDLIRLK